MTSLKLRDRQEQLEIITTIWHEYHPYVRTKAWRERFNIKAADIKFVYTLLDFKTSAQLNDEYGFNYRDANTKSASTYYKKMKATHLDQPTPDFEELLDNSKNLLANPYKENFRNHTQNRFMRYGPTKKQLERMERNQEIYSRYNDGMKYKDIHTAMQAFDSTITFGAIKTIISRGIKAGELEARNSNKIASNTFLSQE